MRERAYDVPEPGQGVLSGGSHPEHVGELAGRHLDTDAGEESDQDGAGEKIRQEPEPGQPGQQQQRAGEQGCQPGQPDVSLRPGDREPGQRGGEDGGGGRVRADDEMARRTENGEHGHREQQRVQAGHHRHPGDLRVPENLGDAQGGQRHAGEHVRGYPGPVDGQQPLHHGQCPQPAPLAATARSRHRLAPARFPAVFSDWSIIRHGAPRDRPRIRDLPITPAKLVSEGPEPWPCGRDPRPGDVVQIGGSRAPGPGLTCRGLTRPGPARPEPQVMPGCSARSAGWARWAPCTRCGARYSADHGSGPASRPALQARVRGLRRWRPVQQPAEATRAAGRPVSPAWTVVRGARAA